jgi:hypothetical protein
MDMLKRRGDTFEQPQTVINRLLNAVSAMLWCPCKFSNDIQQCCYSDCNSEAFCIV